MMDDGGEEFAPASEWRASKEATDQVNEYIYVCIYIGM